MDRRIPLPAGTQLRFTNREGGAVRYTVGREIGRGGSCIVYDGSYETNAGLSRTVRIRECFPWRAELERRPDGQIVAPPREQPVLRRALERFRSDFRTGIRLFAEGGLSDTLVNSLDIYEGNGTAYAVFVYSPEDTLAARQPDTLRGCLAVAASAGRALEKIHQAGYLYLDLKPDNVLTVPGSERVLLFDLDSLVSLEDLRSGRLAGEEARISCSSQYAPLELRQGRWKKLGTHTDVYTLGALLFQLLFGRPPVAPDCDPEAVYDYDASRFDPSLYPDRLFDGLTDFFHRGLADYIPDRRASMEEAARALEALLPLADPAAPFLRFSFPAPPPLVIGREREMAALSAWLDRPRGGPLFVTGMGGIGKSTLVRRFLADRAGDLDTVLYLQYRGSVSETLCDDTQLFIATVERRPEETAGQYAQRKLRHLRRLLGQQRAVLVLDSFDGTAQEDLRVLFCPEWRTILITRQRALSQGFETLEIQALEKREDLRHLLEAYLGRPLEKGEYASADRMIRCAAGHTLAVELMARQIAGSYLSLAEAAALAERWGVVGIAREKVGYVRDQVERYDTVASLIGALFDAGSLSPEKRDLLRLLALFGPEGLEIRTFQALTALPTLDPLRELLRDGWSRAEGSVVSLHPVIGEAVRRWAWTKGTRDRALSLMTSLTERLRREHVEEEFTPSNAPEMRRLLRLCEAVLDGCGDEPALAESTQGLELLYRTAMALPRDREDAILEKAHRLLSSASFPDVQFRLNLWDRVAFLYEQRGDFQEALRVLKDARAVLNRNSGAYAWGCYFDMVAGYHDEILNGFYQARNRREERHLRELLEALTKAIRCLRRSTHPSGKKLLIQCLLSKATVLTRSAPERRGAIRKLLSAAWDGLESCPGPEDRIRGDYHMSRAWYHTLAVRNWGQTLTSLEIAQVHAERSSPSVLDEIDMVLVPTANILLTWRRFAEAMRVLERGIDTCGRYPDVVPFLRRRLDLLSFLLETCLEAEDLEKARAVLERFDRENARSRPLGVEKEIPAEVRAMLRPKRFR